MFKLTRGGRCRLAHQTMFLSFKAVEGSPVAEGLLESLSDAAGALPYVVLGGVLHGSLPHSLLSGLLPGFRTCELPGGGTTPKLPDDAGGEDETPDT